MFGEQITIGESLIITLIAITTVFIILILIALATLSFKYLFREKENVMSVNSDITFAKNNSEIKPFNIKDIVDEEEIAAIIVATIECNLKDEDKVYKIINLKEL
ncbi:MAG: OadG family protein [Lachnospirales bacterium]